MPTENPKPAPGQEINISDIPNRSGAVSTPIPSLLDAINQEASKNGPLEETSKEPPPEPVRAEKTPPAQPQREIQPKETPKPPAEPAQKKKEGIESVREAYERAQKKASELEGSLTTTAKEKADAFAKVAELEGKLAKYADEIEKDYKPRMARLEQQEKELQKAREVLKIKAYQETPEFHDKFVKPLADARAEVGELLAELIVVEGENQRPATAQDFDEILAAKSINEAARIAAQKFGPEVYQQVVNYRTRIRSLERTRQEEVKNAALRAEEWERTTQQQMSEHQRAVRERILSEANKLIQGDANIAVPDGDTELKAALTEGMQHADLLLNPNPNMAQEEYLAQIGKGRAAIIKYPVLEKKFAKLQKEHDELKEQLKQYQASEPDVRGRSGGNARSVVPTNSEESRAKLLEEAQKLATSH